MSAEDADRSATVLTVVTSFYGIPDTGFVAVRRCVWVTDMQGS